jgi:NADP-dependent 3-hydroxy acid dehydrogenase YdfG
MAKALEENGAKVYIIGRRLEVLEKAAQQAVCLPSNRLRKHQLININ